MNKNMTDLLNQLLKIAGGDTALVDRALNQPIKPGKKKLELQEVVDYITKAKGKPRIILS
jgi:hypothetical protein